MVEEAAGLLEVDPEVVVPQASGRRGYGAGGGSFRPYPPFPSPLAGGLTARWVATPSLWSSAPSRFACADCGSSALAASRGGVARGARRDLLIDALGGEGREATLAAGFAAGVGSSAPAPSSALAIGARVGELESGLALLPLYGAAQAAQTTKRSKR